ncbi:hypothetical protein [Capnocytophaga sp. oral taxon 864]|uniref:hypothetical protein n=1 Tax=Capnocytophaga sp. oral taxon 864 TaxID=1316593 RepID=UPI000D0412AE|nr:hypothetical protein [Capnocytophaga sp. oral taxon 864]AVM56087.1 hypothetical protein C3V44_11055 [Capnocytophaga sp. oral taxon 864]
MKKILFLVALLPLTLVAQTVIVPNRYTFQKEDNQYQLNALTKFLLEKQGFKAYMESEVPAELLQNPCDALKADVKNQSNMMTSKVQFILTDCANKTVFTSEIGKSREKEFKKSYQEALRNAFEGNALATFKSEYKALVTTQTAMATLTPAQPTTITKSNTQIIEEDPYIEFLYAKKVDFSYELYDKKTNELRYKIKPTLTLNTFVAYDLKNNEFGVLEKDGSTFYKFTLFKKIDDRGHTFLANIQFTP